MTHDVLPAAQEHYIDVIVLGAEGNQLKRVLVKDHKVIKEQSFKVAVASTWYDIAISAGYSNAKYQLHDSVIVFRWRHDYRKWKKTLQILDCFNARREGKLFEFMYEMLCNINAFSGVAVLRRYGIA